MDSNESMSTGEQPRRNPVLYAVPSDPDLRFVKQLSWQYDPISVAQATADLATAQSVAHDLTTYLGELVMSQTRPPVNQHSLVAIEKLVTALSAIPGIERTAMIKAAASYYQAYGRGIGEKWDGRDRSAWNQIRTSSLSVSSAGWGAITEEEPTVQAIIIRLMNSDTRVTKEIESSGGDTIRAVGDALVGLLNERPKPHPLLIWRDLESSIDALLAIPNIGVDALLAAFVENMRANPREVQYATSSTLRILLTQRREDLAVWSLGYDDAIYGCVVAAATGDSQAGLADLAPATVRAVAELAEKLLHHGEEDRRPSLGNQLITHVTIDSLLLALLDHPAVENSKLLVAIAVNMATQYRFRHMPETRPIVLTLTPLMRRLVEEAPGLVKAELKTRLRFIVPALWSLPGDDGADWLHELHNIDDHLTHLWQGMGKSYKDNPKPHRWPDEDWSKRLDVVARWDQEPEPYIVDYFFTQKIPAIACAAASRVGFAHAGAAESVTPESKVIRHVGDAIAANMTQRVEVDVNLYDWDGGATRPEVLGAMLSRLDDVQYAESLLDHAVRSGVFKGEAAEVLTNLRDPKPPVWSLTGEVNNAGTISLTQGVLGAGDPWSFTTVTQELNVEPGDYKLRLHIASHPHGLMDNAAAELVLVPDATPTQFERLTDFAYMVEVGIGSFGTPDAITAVLDHEEEIGDLPGSKPPFSRRLETSAGDVDHVLCRAPASDLRVLDRQS